MLVAFGQDAHASTAPNTTQGSQPPVSAAATQEREKAEREKLRAEKEKLIAEKGKLEEELKALKISNEAIDASTKKMATLMGTGGALFGTILGILITVLLNHKLNAMQAAKTELESEKLAQELNLELFKNLGHDSLRVQFGAASVLLDKVARHYASIQNSKSDDKVEARNVGAIIKVLVSIIKEKPEPSQKGAGLGKYIGDNLVISLGAVVPGDLESPEPASSPLKQYDFQRSQLTGVLWQRVDARDVDFFEADLSESSLRKAFLNKAMFYKANLSNSVLEEAKMKGADLTNAHLRSANLKGTDMRDASLCGADLEGANLDDKSKLAGAKYDERTKWPDANFDPSAWEMVEVEAGKRC